MQWIVSLIVFSFLGIAQAQVTPEEMPDRIPDEMTELEDSDTHSTLGEIWTQGPYEQAIGFYAKGKLVDASIMSLTGPAHKCVNVHRKRYYGTYDAVTIVTSAANHVRSVYTSGDPLIVGDISTQKGGKILGHSSHRNGLDIDLGYYTMAGRNNPNFNRNMLGSSLVRGNLLSSEFDYERNFELMKFMVNTGRVSRIFVNKTIKKAMCNYSKKIGGDNNNLLRLLRPYPGHGNHLHVRLTCPEKSPRCINQKPPTDIGC